ncbi:TonB-dependent receptor P39 [Dyadobacter sp. CECT 9275]|uniref:TonB-dependent receptor P39 n=1 Tax=Dyadobacter helix TaxID=2822344 RepID=A0A916N688_9BACT|nr:TonB-dependent receptor [Dyadobacter sp. CECT 9275]CAG5002338.1 TonB-dependent receptor P39 [Dyadobacter sp. CECT 9275]
MQKRILLCLFHWKPCLLSVVLTCLCISVAFSQTAVRVSGKIIDEKNEGLPGVNIQVKGTTTGATTDADGNYSLNATPGSSLIFSFIGYQSQEIAVGNSSVINVTLKADVAVLQEVLVVGYGKQSRETLTTSITKLDTKALENVPYTNAASALQGTVSGVRVQSTSGQPGSAPRVIVRGGTSINNPNGASPLYIIDGVIRTDMNDVNSEDIESMQVLKDAASTAIYGARGSNGVVIITTKSGKSGQTRISYSYDLTTSKPGKLFELANARDYLTLNRLGVFSAPKFGDYTSRLILPMGYGTGNDLTNNTAFTTQYLTSANEHKLKEGWQSMPDPADPTKTLIFQDTDFQALNYQTGVSHNHNLGITGGTEKATFNAGVGYMTADGTVITTKYSRLSFNLNGEIQVKKNLSVFSRVMFSKAKSNIPYSSTAVTFYRNAGLAPTAKYKFEDGTLAPGTNNGIGNPEYQMNTRKYDNSNEKLTISLGSHWDILPGLSFEPQISMYNISRDVRSFQPGYWNGPLAYVDSRVSSASSSKWRQTQAEGVLAYTKTLAKDHNLDVRAGLSYFVRDTSGISASGRGASTDLIPTLNASGEATAVSGTVTRQAIMGYFGSANYNYQMKYLLTVNMRYDGASNLGEEYKWGFFPGVSLGWNIHKEDFWNGISRSVSQLKLRGSYGVNGNISGLGDFTAYGAYGVGAKYGGAAAIQNTVIPNKDLKWEQSKTFDVGADFGFLDNRITMILDYYRRVTSNLLTSLPLPQSTGFGSVLTNLGSLENRGFEVELGARVTSTSSPLQWNVAFNASKTKNKVLKLPYNGIENNRVGGILIWDDAKQDYAWKGGLQEGVRLGEMYDRQQVRIYPTDEDAKNGPIASYIVGADKTQYGGDVEYYDADKNGTIDSRDKRYMGNAYPVWTGGLSNTLSFKNFNLYVRMDYTTGHTIFNWGRLFLDGNLYSDGNLTQRMVDRSWKKQGDITDMPRSYWGGERVQRNLFDGVTTSGNSQYMESGDFLAIREVTLSYSVPSKILNKLKIANLRFNVTANNIHYFTKYLGLNPEEGGTDDGRYAMPKNIIFGANLSF